MLHSSLSTILTFNLLWVATQQDPIGRILCLVLCRGSQWNTIMGLHYCLWTINQVRGECIHDEMNSIDTTEGTHRRSQNFIPDSRVQNNLHNLVSCLLLLNWITICDELFKHKFNKWRHLPSYSFGTTMIVSANRLLRSVKRYFVIKGFRTWIPRGCHPLWRQGTSQQNSVPMRYQ